MNINLHTYMIYDYIYIYISTYIIFICTYIIYEYMYTYKYNICTYMIYNYLFYKFIYYIYLIIM